MLFDREVGMRVHARISLLALVVGGLIAALAPTVAQAAGFGVEKGAFYSITCSENEPIGKAKECSPSTPSQFFTQAGGHPNFGVTDFSFNGYGTLGNGVKTIRTDLPVGFSTNPRALPQCSMSDFEANLDKAEANHCGASTEAGVQEITVVLAAGPPPVTATLTGKVYNLEPQQGAPLEYGIDLELPFLGGIHVHSFLVGGVSWHKEAIPTAEGIESGNYHEYFTIAVSKSISEGEAPIVNSRLIFNGKAGSGMLTTPTACPGPQATHLWVESYEGETSTTSYTTTATSAEEHCDLLSFEPAFTASTSPQAPDEGTQLATEVKFPINKSSAEKENSDLKTTTVVLPEGFSINPAAAKGLTACTAAELNTETVETECPARSQIGTAVVDVPGLPRGALTGKIFLGASALPITGPPYTVYVAVGSERYGQALRLVGEVKPNLETGQLTTVFDNNPQGPFEDVKLTFDGGAFADIANPLSCGEKAVSATFTPYANPVESTTLTPKLSVAGGICPGTASFAPTQSTTSEPAQGAGSSTFTFNINRPEGQQYVKSVRTVLPAGLSAIVPSVVQCGEPQASKGECSSASQIGTAVVTAGSGPEPMEFNGTVYFTGPTEGAPFGLSIVTPVVAGPFNFGNEVTRAKIEVNPSTAQVIATTTLPTIKQGVPIRLRSLKVTINRQGFERNPTSCSAATTTSSLTSTLGTTATATSSFQPEGCSSLAFKPTFTASTSGKPSKANGASLVTTITQPAGQANIKSVVVTLPKQLPSRLSTLNKACLAATFEANPASCPAGSKVGTATAVTPVLPGTMKGLAYFVSHGGAAFPDLDLVLEGANGVRVILVGNTNIKNGITTTTFATTPDVPVSSITVNLPLASNSALAANGSLCAPTLTMPTTITAQNGKTFKQNTVIAPTGCGVQIVGHKVIGNTAYLTVKTFAAGRISGTGSGLSSTYRTLGAASKAATLKVPLSSRGRARRRPFKVKLRVGFVPKKGAHSAATVTVTFR